MSLYRSLALSDHWIARAVRRTYRGFLNFSIPAPRLLFRPLLWLVLAIRQVWYFTYRVFVCEPLFKAYCREYGTNLHTGAFLHFVDGQGDLILGNNVLVTGKCTFLFAARFSERPQLIIGDDSGIGHGCTFSVGKSITIGRKCRIANFVRMLDSPGHPLDPEKRAAGLPPDPDSVRPIRIGDNVWIGAGAVIFPGVTVGDNSVIGAEAVVMTDVPANMMVSGNPARKTLVVESPRTTAV